MAEPKKTPLFDVHQSLGAKMVEFAGFMMPVAYGSIIEEHRAVRERAGIFDVSHMGEFQVSGPSARTVVNEIITNDLSNLEPGGVLYTVMCRESGGVIDDLLVFLVADDRIILVVNAANREKDFAHVKAFEKPGATIEDLSDDYALIAVQGPRSLDVLRGCSLFASTAEKLEAMPYYRGFAFEAERAEILVSRTGYTGERGYEIFLPAAQATMWWESITEAGRALDMAPVGLGARDTLRFEACYCLYGHELDEDTSPLEAGLGWVVKLKKDRFVGHDALVRQKAEGAERTLVGLEIAGRNIARQGYSVAADGQDAGVVTSGAFSPTLQKSLCMASIRSEARASGARFMVDVRGRQVDASLTSMPFYKSRAR